MCITVSSGGCTPGAAATPLTTGTVDTIAAASQCATVEVASRRVGTNEPVLSVAEVGVVVETAFTEASPVQPKVRTTPAAAPQAAADCATAAAASAATLASTDTALASAKAAAASWATEAAATLAAAAATSATAQSATTDATEQPVAPPLESRSLLGCILARRSPAEAASA